MIPISRVDIGPEEERIVLEVLRSGHLAQGPMVERFEHGFARVSGTRHAVAVANGTLALVCALELAGVGAGDEVVTTPFTFVATLNAIIERGATVRFVDIDPLDFTIDPEQLQDVLSERVRAVVPVHLYGLPADMMAIAARLHGRDITIIEDAAQAHGATVRGQPVGSFGIGCFSLYATKNVTTGEGGVITTDDDSVAQRARLLRNQGMRRRYEYEVAGHNYRLTDLHAAVGVAQLGRLAHFTERRRSNAAYLTTGLAGVRGFVCPIVPEGRTHVFHQYTVRITDGAAVERDELAARLSELGVGTGVYYPRVAFDYECYRDHPLIEPAAVPEARRAANEVLSLPVHPSLEERHLARIVEAVHKILS